VSCQHALGEVKRQGAPGVYHS